ncbi:MAG: 30S ribosomal protein S8 [Candidatus Aureabacteria bacterium]|nr:30S ribosomal protein S8 [Candidatus Auribacterota bacterium]
MTMTDPVADMLTRIRNANKARNEYVDIPSSKIKLNLTRLLKSEGYIEDFKVVDIGLQGVLRLFLKYTPEGERVITGLKKISTPGGRRYVGVKKMTAPLGGLGIAVLSTPKGMMTDRQARDAGVGGEVLCYVW